MKNKIFFSIFMIIWVGLTIFNLLVPKKVFSEQENRYLAKIPKFIFETVVDGAYAKSLNEYINDHFIARNFWVKMNSFVQLAIGKKDINEVYIGKDGYLFEKFKYTDEKKENVEKTIQAINNFTEKVQLPQFFMLLPNSIYINEDKLPKNVDVYDQEEIIQEFYKKINNIKTINVSKQLLNEKDNQLYYRTDHHMTSYGAYIAYLQFCKENNLTPVRLSNMKEEIVSNEFLGTFDSKAQIVNQKKDTIKVYKNSINENVKGNYDGVEYDSIFNENYLKNKDKYSYFLNGNSAKAIIKTNIKNGKKLLVIKDSYAHIMAQFLCQNYEEIHFLDLRYYRLPMSDYIKENDINEILFVYNVSNILTDINLRTLR